jgi:small subunit ribosomal protein S13
LLKGFTLGEARLRRFVSNNINNLFEINSYAGVRHSLHLPVRGQRTRTNAGTMRRSNFSGKNLDL